MLRVVIADDNKHDGSFIAGMIKHLPGSILEGCVSDYASFIELLELAHPQVIFLSVDIGPVVSTLEAVSAVCPKSFVILMHPAGLFQQDYLKLFVFHHIIKPMEYDHLKAIMDRVNFIIQDYRKHLKDRLSRLVSDHRHPCPDKKILVHSEGGFIPVGLQDILMLKREDRKTALFTHEGNFKIHEPLDLIESRLGGPFFRCHKGFIVNVDKISSVTSFGGRAYLIRLIDSKMTAIMTVEKKKLFEQIYSLT